jgi:Glycosyl hydrolases family 18
MKRKGAMASGVAAVVVAVALLAAVGQAASAAKAGAARATGPAPHSWYSFAPYADLTSYPPPNLTAIRRDAGVKDVTLAFVTAENDTQCVPTWGGYPSYPAYGSSAYQRAATKAFQRAGGSVVVSFGGEAGAELATVCKTVGALESAYEKVISAYGANHVDFDIEGADNANFAAAKRRAAALAALQTEAARHGRQLSIGLTLPVLPSGLTADDKRLIADTAGGGVSVSLVNGMAMDFGDSAAPSPANKMGTYAIDVAKNLRRQLHSVFPSLNESALASLIGITPMIGINDTSDEVFTLANARQLVAYAKQQKLGMLGMWELGRDSQCAQPVTSAQTNCSGVEQKPWAFAKLLRR